MVNRFFSYSLRAHHRFHQQRPEERRPKQPIQDAVPRSKTPWPLPPYLPPSRGEIGGCRLHHHPTQNVASPIETLEGSRPTAPPPRSTLSLSGVQAPESLYHFRSSLSCLKFLMREKPTSLRTLPPRLLLRYHWILRLLGFSIPPPPTSTPPQLTTQTLFPYGRAPSGARPSHN